MSILEQLQIDFNNLIAREDRASADLAEQLHLRSRIQELAQQLAQRSIADLELVRQHVVGLRQVPIYDEAPSIAHRFAPEPLPSEQFAHSIFEQSSRIQ